MSNMYHPIDEQLRRVYENTDYCIHEPAFCLRIGEACPPLEALLRKKKARLAVFITAWNPGSQPLSARENEQRQATLLDVARAGGWAFYSGYGQGRDGQWPAEESILLIGPDEENARRLGRVFGQVAIVGYPQGGPAELWSCQYGNRESGIGERGAGSGDQ
jgi:hypothetical protein